MSLTVILYPLGDHLLGGGGGAGTNEGKRIDGQVPLGTRRKRASIMSEGSVSP